MLFEDLNRLLLLGLHRRRSREGGRGAAKRGDQANLKLLGH